jgi:hypothetical protein
MCASPRLLIGRVLALRLGVSTWEAETARATPPTGRVSARQMHGLSRSWELHGAPPRWQIERAGH